MRELLLIAVFYGFYMLTRLLLNPAGTTPAFTHADQILGFERAWKLDIEAGLNRSLLMVPWLAHIANVFYATAHFLVTLAVLIWVYRHRPGHYRWLRTALMTATAVALIGFSTYPLAPPRFLPDEGFVDPVMALNAVGLYSAPGSGALTNQYAAMPSMHAGWALWCGFVLLRLCSRPWVKALGVFHPTATVLVILATANHYVLDVAAGMALTAVALAASWALYHMSNRQDLICGKEIDFLRKSDAPSRALGSGDDARPVEF